MRDNEFCDVTLASVDNQQFKVHNGIFSASSIFFQKFLVNKKNHNPLKFMRGTANESNFLNPFILKKQNLKEAR